MQDNKIFKVPWGSENICHWCKKDYKCSYYINDREVDAFFYGVIPIKIRASELIKLGSLRACPYCKPEHAKLAEQFKDCKIVIR